MIVKQIFLSLNFITIVKVLSIGGKMFENAQLVLLRVVEIKI